MKTEATEKEIFMRRCIELALAGQGSVAPNPLVGCVVVHKGRIIGEGYHKQYGKNHAEVEAIQSVQNQLLLRESSLYVNLEPCSHIGKTPPCTNFILRHNIPEVIIGQVDIFPEVSGRGIKQLSDAGCRVKVGILENECAWLNRRFITFYEKKRPYIILKWAQSADGYIDIERTATTPTGPAWINDSTDLITVHKWRSEEQAIMAGTQTIINDNPKLTTRLYPGVNPIRITIDKHLRLKPALNIFDNSAPTIIFTEKQAQSKGNISFITIDFSADIIPQVLKHLYLLNIQSLIVEGGRKLLDSFICSGFWDEARIMTGQQKLNYGLPAPVLNCKTDSYIDLHSCRLRICKNCG